MSCVKCKARPVPQDNGGRAPLCRECRAELILSGEEARLGTLDRIYSDNPDGFSGKVTSLTWEELVTMDPVAPFGCRGICCEVCGKSEPYDPMKTRQGWPCERCKKHGLACCMAMVVREFKAVSLCRLCRAELALSADDSIEKAHEPRPGTPEVKP